MGQVTRTLPGHYHIKEPTLIFNGNKLDANPLRGIKTHGPYSQSLNLWPEIRLAFLCTEKNKNELQSIFRELRAEAKTKDVQEYYPDYPGFQAAFRVPLVPAEQGVNKLLSDELNEVAARQDYFELAKKLSLQLGQMKLQRQSFDVVIIYLPDEWASCFNSEGFDLHNYLKAFCAPVGVPFQIITKTAMDRKCRSNVMWGLGIALYAKANGIPWKLPTIKSDEAYIGISYAQKPISGEANYFTCCSQIIEPDGLGFEFVAYDARIEQVDKASNPYLSREQMQSLLLRSLQVYQRNHRGQAPKKITVHKKTHFTDDEIAGALDSFNESTEIELVQIVDRAPVFGLKWKGDKADLFAVSRGTYLPISSSEALLWTQGPTMGANLGNPNFQLYKDFVFSPTSKPVLLKRFAGNGGWHDTCLSILGLTKMDWNNNTLHKKMPATLEYSDRFAKIIKQNPDMVNQEYDIRCFM